MRSICSLSVVAFTALVVGCSADADNNASGGTSAIGIGGTAGTAVAGAGGTSGVGGVSGTSGAGGVAGMVGVGGSAGSAGAAGAIASGGTGGAAGVIGTGGSSGVEATGGSSGSAGGGGMAGGTAGDGGGECTETGAAETFSFFVTSYQGLFDLAGNDDGFGGDLRYNGAATGLEGADAICQELARRVCFGHRTWHAYLSTSTVDAKDRIGSGPWYDHAGELVADNVSGLLSGDRPAGGAMDTGTYDEAGIYHDGRTDVNNDGLDDDDHDTMTATNADGTYAGFSCEDWTSKTATDESGGDEGGGGFPFPGGFPGLSGGIMMGHAWPAMSGQHWSTSHAGHQCAPGTNFVQDGPGDGSTVGGGGGYGGFFCFALPE